MALEVWTARIGSVDGDDVLDVTRKSAGPNGLPFAPSIELLGPILRARARQRALFMRAGPEDRATLVEQARELEHEAWERYVPAYLAEMRASYRRERSAWARLLERPRVCLVCYCPKSERCHRTVLAREILPKLGAIYASELEPVKRSRQGALFTVEATTEGAGCAEA